jgi:Ca2+-binding RTX toxin-like protein
VIGPDLTITLTDGQGIEIVIGSPYVDRIVGNDRDNKLIGAGGEDVLIGGAGNDTLRAGIVKTVYLDFDSATEPEKEELAYTPADRDEVQSILEEDYSAFDIVFTQSRPAENEFVTIRFNDTPIIGGRYQAGGQSADIGWRSLELAGEVIVDVNGFFGFGLESTQFPNPLPLQTADNNNFLQLSAMIAGHELAHFYGLRHHDSMGPIGSGLFEGVSVDRFTPAYPEAVSTMAFETPNHLAASPASVRTTLADALNNPFLGERGALKLAFADTGTVIGEAPDEAKSGAASLDLDWNPETPPEPVVVQDLGILPPLTVPNTLGEDATYAGKDFDVQAVNIVGWIKLDETGHSESDFYKFHARPGFLTVELLSGSLRRIDDSVDSVVRVFNAATGERLDYYGSPFGAFNDDGIEQLDSLLVDVPIPEVGEYIVEVDTFYLRIPEFAAYAPPGYDVDRVCSTYPDRDDCADTDRGAYELLLYQFNTTDRPFPGSGDYLEGGAGADLLIGGSGIDTFADVGADDTVEDKPGYQFGLRVDCGGNAAIAEGNSVDVDSASFTSLNMAPILHTASIDWGDGSDVETGIKITSTGGGQPTYLPSGLSHRYLDDGIYTVVIEVSDDEFGLAGWDSFLVLVGNLAPIIDSIDVPAWGAEGTSVQLNATASDPGELDSLSYLWQIITPEDALIQLSGTSVDFTPEDDGQFWVSLTVADGDGGVTASQPLSITVDNVAPVIKNVEVTSPVDEGQTVTLLATASDVAGENDPLTYDWAILGPMGELPTVKGAEASFVPPDNGSYRIHLIVEDDAGGSDQRVLDVDVHNVDPTITSLSIPSHGQTDKPLVLSASATDPAGEYDTLSYEWTVTQPNSTATIWNGNEVSFIPSQAGEHQVHLALTDGDGGVAQASQTVTVVVPLPIIELTVPETGQEGTALEFSASQNAPRAPLLYTWTVIHGDTSTRIAWGMDRTHVTWTPPDDGRFEVQLEARNQEGAVATYSATLEVGNVDPEITGFLEPANPAEGESISVSAKVSDAGAADTLTYTWTVTVSGVDTMISTGSAANGASVPFEFTPPDDGRYNVRLRVWDDDGGEASQLRQIIVANTDPTIASFVVPETAEEGELVHLTATATDPAGSQDLLDYHWTVTREEDPTYSIISTRDQFAFAPPDNDTYTVVLQVSDGDEGVATRSQHIQVSNIPPRIERLNGPSEAPAGSTVFASAVATDPGSLDAPSFVWDLGDGSSPQTGNVPDNGLITVDYLYANAGTYEVTLTVTDKDGQPTSASFSVTILSAVQQIDKLVDDVQDYVNSGVLNSGEGNSLIRKLEGAQAKLDQGDTNAGVNQLRAFINEIKALMNARRLTPGQGGALVASAEQVITSALPGSPMLASAESPENPASFERLTDQLLRPVVTEAIAYWSDSGVDPQRLTGLSEVPIQVVDLPGRHLGLASSKSIWIDLDAAGHGWFFDTTFTGSRSIPSDRIDLLSVVTHELGHVLGYDHAAAGGVMEPFIAPGDRLSVGPRLHRAALYLPAAGSRRHPSDVAVKRKDATALDRVLADWGTDLEDHLRPTNLATRRVPSVPVLLEDEEFEAPVSDPRHAWNPADRGKDGARDDLDRKRVDRNYAVEFLFSRLKPTSKCP